MNSVPPSACSNRPIRLSVAPVNAPRTWPNSSLSTSDAGTAAAFTATNGPFFRGPFWCSAWATSSLPVPVSPRIRTVLSTGAARWIL